MFVSKVIFAIVLLSVIGCSFGSNKNDEKKTLLLKKIINRVANLTDHVTMLPAEKRVHALHVIKDDLAGSLGSSLGHYINIVMKELVTKTRVKEMITMENNDTNAKSNRRNLNYVEKYQLIQNISNKIVSLTDKYIEKAKLGKLDNEVFNKISNRVLRTTAQLNNGKFKSYEDIFLMALNVSKHKLFKNNTLEADRDVQTVLNLEEVDEFGRLLLSTLEGIDPHCKDILDKICLRFKTPSEFSCNDGKSIDFNTFFNAIINFDHSTTIDNCPSNVLLLEKNNQTKEVLEEIESNDKCFFQSKTDLEREEIKTKIILLRNILSSYGNLTNYKSTGINNNEIDNAAVILKLLSQAIEVPLCLRNLVESAREKTFGYSPKDCKCKDELCGGHCDDLCNRTCWQKHSLNRYNCLAIEGNTSLSLDILCDGKLDCYDGSDEAQCAKGKTHYKFEAFPIFQSLLQTVNIKTLSSEFKHYRNKLAALARLIKQIEKIVSMTTVDANDVKNLRDDAFSTIKSIYADLMTTSSFDQLNAYYTTLYVFKQLLINALKMSYTGNTEIPSSITCLCKHSICILTQCTTNCTQACKAEPILTQISCSNDNVSLPIDVYCDGKNDCSDGEDELNCNKEVCRAHHLVMLQKSVDSIHSKHKSIYLKEAVENWKTKVITDLKNEKSNERPNHKTIKEIVKRILQDLVNSYGSLENHKSLSTEMALKDLTEISKTVQLSIKSCGI